MPQLDRLTRVIETLDVAGADRGAQILRGEDDIHRAHQRLMWACRLELRTTELCAHPVAGVEPEAWLAERGVAVRLLTSSTEQSRLAVRSRLERLVRAGGHVRTVTARWIGITVADATTLLRLRGSCQSDDCALLVEDALMTEQLSSLFDHGWAAGVALEATQDHSMGSPVAAPLRAVAGTLALGCSDETGARRLGMSVRTYRRHVAALLDLLGAQSRFQAGLVAQQWGLAKAH